MIDVVILSILLYQSANYHFTLTAVKFILINIYWINKFMNFIIVFLNTRFKNFILILEQYQSNLTIS